MSPDDREMFQDIRAQIEKIAASVDRDEKITRAMSVTLTGRVNGDVVDPAGGRIGRLEHNVELLMDFRQDIKMLLAKWTGIIIGSVAIVEYVLPWVVKHL